MSNQRAQLDSAATTIEDLITRVGAAADDFEQAGDEAAAGDLYEVERSLRAAHRRLLVVVRRVD